MKALFNRSALYQHNSVSAKRRWFRALSVFVATVLAVNALSLSLALSTTQKADAVGALANVLKPSPTSTSVEAETGTVALSAKAIWHYGFGWTNAQALNTPTTVTASVVPGTGELASSCASGDWQTSITKNISLGAVIEGTFCYRSNVRGTQTVNFSTSIARVFGDSPKVLASSATVDVIDTTAPDAFLVSPTDGAVVNGSSLTQIWGSNASDVGHFVYQSWHDPAATSLRWEETFTTTSKTALNVAEGTFWWRVKTVDHTGNESGWTSLWKITIDNTVPTTPVITAPLNEQYFNATPIVNTWTPSTDASGISKYQVEYIYDDGHTFAGGPYRDVAGHLTTRNHVPNNSEQGGVTIRVRAFDNAGNFSGWSNPVHYYYDATAPVVNITNPLNNDLLSGTVNLTGTVTDASPMNSYFRIEKANGTFIDSSLFTDGRTLHEFSWDTTGVDDGAYRIFFEARDKANNKDGSRAAPADSVMVIDVVVDNTEPVVTINSLTTTDDSPELNGTVDDPTAIVEVTVDGTTYTATNNGDGTWKLAAGTIVPALSVGSYAVEATATDTAGNGNTDSNTLTIEDAGTGSVGGGSGTPSFAPTNAPLPVTTFANFNQPLLANNDNEEENEETQDISSTNTESEDGDVAGATTEDGAGANQNLWWLWILLAIAAVIAFYMFAKRRAEQSE